MTAPRRPRSAWLLVGSTPGTLAKLHSAGQPLSRFFAKVRWRRLRAALRAASSSSARSSSWSGPMRSSRRLRSASPRNSPQAANNRSATRSPAAPNCFWAPSPSLWAVKSRTRCARAELASLRVEVVVGPPAVRAGHAGELLAEQRLRLAAVAIGSDAKDRGAKGERPPERALAAAQAPAGLVDVERRGGAHVPEQVLVGFVEGPGHALHDGVDRAAREFGAEELPQKLCGVAPRDAVAHREGGDRRLQARAEGSRRHSGGQLGARLQAALRAAQALQAMLAEDDRRRRQLRDLMARGRPERRALRGAEHVAAAAAGGPVVEKLVERLDRRQMTTASRMARLGAAPAPRGSSLPALRRGRRILAGRQRGVARVAVQAPLKLGDALLLLGEALAQLGDLTPEQSVLGGEFEEHSDDRFTSLLIDRLSLGALHAQGLRGVGVRACLYPLGDLLLSGPGWTN